MIKREKMLRVRFSEDEWNALNVRAQEAGMSMSEIVRDHLGKVKVRNRKDEKERTIMLNRINANLNMIARWANTYKKAGETTEVVAHLIAINRKIRDLVSRTLVK